MRTPNDPMVAALEAESRAEQIALPRIDEAAAVPRPASIGTTYAELENEALEDEQPKLFAASGTELSRTPNAEAAGLAPAAEAGQRLADGHVPILEATERRVVAITDALASYRRRPPKAARWHYATKSALLIGDVTGIAGAAIWMGEVPVMAVIMAISAATAAVTAGLSGAEVRDVRNRERRARPAEDLAQAQQPFAHLFRAPDRGWPFVKALVWVSVAVAATIATGIFALRATIDDPVVGLVFGGFAAAIAAASWIESYMYADDIADLLDNTRADYEREILRHQTLGASTPWRRREEALVEAESITTEHSYRGEAAQSHLKAMRFGILRRNPQVVGHAPAAESPATHQTARRGGTK
ncbi:hypothetical protein [Microbacterium candidum]|uniref:SLATT domain-containing protein n=1 Tax=Microbacterium candidum TaxID=3041922 RepID=A0ABT7N064_9MICO|nr:hypothetical protein [Microbacterium sp. ASV49]MDL9980095.1 hypothetical protein [Microbacterium sp. ASV49]